MIVSVFLPLVLAFIMFSLGLGLRKDDFVRVARFPKAFGAGLVNQLLLLPVVAFGLVLVLQPAPEIAVGIMILACCPGGVTSNILTRLAGGNTPLSISLTAITSLVSIVTVPVLVAFSVHRFMGVDGPEVEVTRLGITMFLLTAVPVGIGMCVTKFAPGFVRKSTKMIGRIATVLFVLVIVAAVIANWEVFSSNLIILGPGLIFLNVIMLSAGVASARVLKLGKADGTAISIESGIQNGTLAIAVGSLIAVDAAGSLPPTTVPAAVYSVVMYFVSAPFVIWRQKVSTRQS